MPENEQTKICRVIPHTRDVADITNTQASLLFALAKDRPITTGRNSKGAAISWTSSFTGEYPIGWSHLVSRGDHWGGIPEPGDGWFILQGEEEGLSELSSRMDHLVDAIGEGWPVFIYNHTGGHGGDHLGETPPRRQPGDHHQPPNGGVQLVRSPRVAHRRDAPGAGDSSRDAATGVGQRAVGTRAPRARKGRDPGTRTDGAVHLHVRGPSDTGRIPRPGPKERGASPLGPRSTPTRNTNTSMSSPTKRCSKVSLGP